VPRVAYPAALVLVWAVACGTSSSPSTSDAGPTSGDAGSTDTGSGSGSSGGGSGGGSSSSGSSSGGSSSGGSGGSSGSGSDAGPGETGKVCPAVSPGDNETYGLPATMNLPSDVTAMTSWTQNPASGGWNGRQVMDACRYEADPGGFLTWHALASARVEVDPGDDPLALGENTERAELLNQQGSDGQAIAEGPTSGTQYYATSYYFPATWAATAYPYSVFETPGSSWPYGTTTDCSANGGEDCNSWSLVLQFHGPGGSFWAALSAASSAPGQPQTMGYEVGTQTFAFSDGGQLLLGKWMDLVLELDWASGAVTIWRRNEGQSTFAQVVSATPTAAPAAGTYMKQGLYRGGTVNGRTDVYWVGPTLRGASFSAVEQAAFGTSAGP
jgi:hypothetical protein